MKPYATPAPAAYTRARLIAATLCLLLSILPSLCAPAFSQTPAATRTVTTGTAATTSDEVIELGLFEVSAKAQTGYISNESVTGTRMPTKVMDLPFNISTITSEFMTDFAIVNMSEIVEGGVITFDSDAGSGSMIRGISASGQLVNGFWMPAGTNVSLAFTDRTEILKGPSAAIYGQTSPGGIINIIPKQPKFKRATSLKIGYGSYNQIAASVETTGPISAKTAYILSLQANDRKFNQPWRRNTAYSAGASILHKFDASTQLRIDLAGSLQRNKAPSNRVPYLYDSAYQNSYTDPATNITYSSTGHYYGIASQLNSTSGTGPNSWKNSDTYSLFGIFEKRLNTIFSYRLGANLTSNHWKGYNTQDLSVYDPNPDHKVPSSANPSNVRFTGSFYGLSRTIANDSSFISPRYDINNQDNGGFQGDLLARYFLARKKIECRTLLTFDFSSRYNYSERWAMPQSIASPTASPVGKPSTENGVEQNIFPWNPVTIGTVVKGKLVTPQWFWANYWMPVVTPLTGDTPYVDSTLYPQYDIYHVPDFNKDTFVQRSQIRSRRDVFGLMFRQQIILWQNLILYTSARYDNVTYHYETISFPAWSVKAFPQYQPWWNDDYYYRNSSWHSAAFKPGAGFNYRAMRWLAIYGNYSSSFNPNTPPINGKQKVLTVLPNEIAWGYDYGVKFSLLKDDLTGTIGGFYISRGKISRTDIDPLTLEATTLATGNMLSRGLEAALNYKITPSWFASAGYYHTNTVWTYTGLDYDLLGRSQWNVPYDIVTLTTKYSFRNGILKGLNIGGNYQYVGTCPAEKGKAFDVTSPQGYAYQVKGYNSGVRDIMIPSVYLINIFANYKFNVNMFGNKTTHTISLNIKNLLDKAYVTQSRSVGDRRTIIGTYTLGF